MAKLSDAEYEIMKIIWEDQEKTTLFSYIMDELIKQRTGNRHGQNGLKQHIHDLLPPSNSLLSSSYSSSVSRSPAIRFITSPLTLPS